jgi:methylenetetrahydrofolate reductase (NADPH)
MENHLRWSLGNHQFFTSAELVLGRDHTVPDADAFVRAAATHPNGIKIISVTDLPGGNPALPPESFIPLVSEHGLTPVAHITGKDGNRSSIEGRLHSLAHMGVENIVALTGDAQKSGFLGKSKPVYDLDAVHILQLIQTMRAGIRYNLGARKLQSAPFDFLSGAVVNPYKCSEPAQMMQYYKLELKILSGARFIVPQLGYNLRKLYELKQYMDREGLGGTPLVANVYVLTPTIAKMMQSGELAGCVVSDKLMQRLQGEKIPQRMERASLMIAAARDLGFAGAHVGGFGLTHADFLTMLDRAGEIGGDWKRRIDELIFESPGEFYLLPQGTSGLSDASAEYQLERVAAEPSLKIKFAGVVHDAMIEPDSPGARFFASRLKPRQNGAEDHAWRSGFWYSLLGVSTAFRKLALGCQSCGDCIQEHLSFSGCTMRWCYKGLRNGPCGGSRIDGTCEADPSRPCIWGQIYRDTRAAGGDPRKFARTLIPPRNWDLDQTNALANRLAGIDNYSLRTDISNPRERDAENLEKR